MIKTKLKITLPACSLLLATALGGCGMDSSMETTAETQKTTEKEISYEASQTESETNDSKETEKEKALLAYQEILKAAPAIEGEYEQLEDASFDYDQNRELFGDHYELYAFYDINQDEVPELIALSMVNFRWTPVSVYTYADGEAILLKDPLNVEAHDTFEQCSIANGAYTTYICEDNHIHSVWRGTNPMGGTEEENYAYVLDGTTLIVVDCTKGESENTINFYDIAKENKAE